MAWAFDLVGVTDTEGFPSFAFFAKGGNRQCLRDGLDKPQGLERFGYAGSYRPYP